MGDGQTEVVGDKFCILSGKVAPDNRFDTNAVIDDVDGAGDNTRIDDERFGAASRVEAIGPIVVRMNEFKQVDYICNESSQRGLTGLVPYVDERRSLRPISLLTLKAIQDSRSVGEQTVSGKGVLNLQARSEILSCCPYSLERDAMIATSRDDFAFHQSQETDLGAPGIGCFRTFDQRRIHGAASAQRPVPTVQSLARYSQEKGSLCQTVGGRSAQRV